MSVHATSMRHPCIRVPAADGGEEKVLVLDIDSTIRSEAGVTIGQLFEKVDRMVKNSSEGIQYMLGGFRIMAR